MLASMNTNDVRIRVRSGRFVGGLALIAVAAGVMGLLVATSEASPGEANIPLVLAELVAIAGSLLAFVGGAALLYVSFYEACPECGQAVAAEEVGASERSAAIASGACRACAAVRQPEPERAGWIADGLPQIADARGERR
jgi:hypothetical protein